MSANIAIGVQDFSTLIENHYFYIDKTDFIKEWWDCLLDKHKCKQFCREISS